MAGISAAWPTPFRGRSYLGSGIGLDLAEETVEQAHVTVRILDVRHVRAARQDQRSRSRNGLADGAVDRRRRLVVLAGHDERRHVDLAETVGDVPAAER